MTFIIDIRRQNSLLLLMYKALFEMAPNRADFVSLLFSRKRPNGIDESTPIEDLLARFENVPPDDMLYKENLQSIEDFLMKSQKLVLTGDDVAGVRKIAAFRDFGLGIDYGTPSAPPSRVTFKKLMTANDNEGHVECIHPRGRSACSGKRTCTTRTIGSIFHVDCSDARNPQRNQPR